MVSKGNVAEAVCATLSEGSLGTSTSAFVSGHVARSCRFSSSLNPAPDRISSLSSQESYVMNRLVVNMTD